jgi:hypothetical protein
MTRGLFDFTILAHIINYVKAMDNKNEICKILFF